MAKKDKNKNQSELFFEDYLQSRGIENYEYEPTTIGKTKRPDYKLRIPNQELFFDVKEICLPKDEDKNGIFFPYTPVFDKLRKHGGAYDLPAQIDDSLVSQRPAGVIGAYDPYALIYNQLEKAWEQFDQYKEYCCSAVLYSAENPLVDLSASFVLGAMFGAIVGVRESEVETNEPKCSWSFVPSESYRTGYLIDSNDLTPKNTHFSSIIILEKFSIGQLKLELEYDRIRNDYGDSIDAAEMLTKLIAAKVNSNETVPRVIVCHNPNAEIALPKDIFVGPFDEQYGLNANCIERFFVGNEIQKSEVIQASQDQLILERLMKKPNASA